MFSRRVQPDVDVSDFVLSKGQTFPRALIARLREEAHGEELTLLIMIRIEFHAECWKEAFHLTLKKPERDKINFFLWGRERVDRLSHVSGICRTQEQGQGQTQSDGLQA